MIEREQPRINADGYEWHREMILDEISKNLYGPLNRGGSLCQRVGTKNWPQTIISPDEILMDHEAVFALFLALMLTLSCSVGQ